MSEEYAKRDLVRWLRAETARTTQCEFRIDLDALDLGSLRELQRLLRDVDADRDGAVRRARMEPRRG